MNGVDDIKDFTKRIEGIEEALAEAAGGNLFARIKTDPSKPDPLTAIEAGINLILSDLEGETAERLRLAEELQRLRQPE
ncbi:hypothetical protein GF359_00370 [candidate division WOR-3 bacterium]|uniref:Uncharacterized protein n=1 Tax=candidate division WOR-3 bacterium TaxID=2052148 RepID=A0A9D5K7E9_UNCW3|nr:hypothetical protein [candidate division WOR-3 bacterium]MBD3363647.1 hypothetical protein [candidate division WOR-3 bacterium]